VSVAAIEEHREINLRLAQHHKHPYYHQFEFQESDQILLSKLGAFVALSLSEKASNFDHDHGEHHYFHHLGSMLTILAYMRAYSLSNLSSSL
jgi:hypothetical protein